jgi:hypothetical protein
MNAFKIPVSVLVVVVGLTTMLVALLTSLSERRRESIQQRGSGCVSMNRPAMPPFFTTLFKPWDSITF